MCWNSSARTMGESTNFRFEPTQGGIYLYYFFLESYTNVYRSMTFSARNKDLLCIHSLCFMMKFSVKLVFLFISVSSAYFLLGHFLTFDSRCCSAMLHVSCLSFGQAVRDILFQIGHLFDYFCYPTIVAYVLADDAVRVSFFLSQVHSHRVSLAQ